MATQPSTKNPFPGMNPFMELVWGDVHLSLLSRIAETLNGELPPDLLARAEERLEMVEADDDPRSRQQLIADGAISERWKRGLPPVWQPQASTEGSSMPVMEPEFAPVAVGEEILRWLEVRNTHGFVVTVIEVLSPTNKTGKRAEFIERRQRVIEAGANVVEIDLLRGGKSVSLAPFDASRPYSVTVYRVTARDRCEIYRTSLRDRLPCFRVPLRPHDNDVPLDLQPLINRVYEAGRYWMDDFRMSLEPQFGRDDGAWVDERLRSAGLIAEA